MEAASARNPGFGDALCEWLMPLYGGAAGVRAPADPRGLPAARRQLAGASRLSRRAVLRVGDAGQHRRASTMPSGSSSGSRCSTATRRWRRPRRSRRYGGLLPPERAAEAAVLGRAMRLGAMLSGSATGVLEHASIARERRAARADAPRAGARVRRRGGGAAAADAGAAAGLPVGDAAGRSERRSASPKRKSGLLCRPLPTFLPRPGPAPTGRFPGSGSRRPR